MKWLSRLFGFIEVRDSGSLAMPPQAPSTTLSLLFLFLTPVSVLRPGKAKAMESPGKFVARLHHFRARFCWSRPAANRSSRIWPDRVAVYFCALAPRVLLRRPTEQPFGKSSAI